MISRALALLTLFSLLSFMMACIGAAGSSGSSTLAITSQTLPNGTVNASYAATLSASGGSAPYSWNVSSGQLPPGVTLSGGGSLAGRPTSSGQFSFAAQVLDSASTQHKASANLSMVITSAAGLTITTTSLTAGTLNTSYSAVLSASGGSTPYSWSIASGQLPPGITLAASGQLSGTPTTAGNYNFTAKVNDQSGSSASQALTIAIGPASGGGQPTIPGATYDASHGYYIMPASLAAGGFSWSSGILHNGAFNVTGWSGAVPSIVVVGRAIKVLNADYIASKSDGTTLSLQLEFDVGPSTTVIFYNSLGAGPGLLTQMTPANHTIPSGWNLFVTQDFESGAVPAGQWIDGNFSTAQSHSDGNPSHTHSLQGISGGVTMDWNVQLPTGTKRIYVSFYEYLDTSFAMNDEMFLYHVYQHPSLGDKIFVENILDWFQDTEGQYNSPDATLLWNIQGGVVNPATGTYYQLFQPSNAAGNWTMQTGRWVQWEIDQKFNTVTHFPAISGTVTVDSTNKTFSRSSGSWVADGVTTGMVLGFAGFTSNTFGGNNSTYNVTAVTSGTITVSDPGNLLTNETSNPGAITYGSSNNDGAFTIYRDGMPLLTGTAINFTGGGADFSQNNTVLQLMASYTKAIWRLPISGSSCQGQDTHAPWTGACSTKIGGGCGYETIPGGWNASCQTGTAQPIDCTPAPMPCPPVFNRYLDDVIVLTQ